MRRVVWILAACALIACDDDGSGPGGDTGPYATVNAFPNLTFSRPTDIQNAGDGSNRLFVTEQTGRVLVFENRSDVAASATFLDITSEVNYQAFSEMGLLGIAFHPRYENNGYFFVYYTTGTVTARRDRLSRFHVGSDPNTADPASEVVLLDFADEFPNHNGGGLCFGGDGYLYVAIGDEGGAGDLKNNAQDRSRLFGKILRLDVDQNANLAPYYGIPSDNPYAGNSQGFRPEIYAYGFRNPWRISYDAQSDLIIAGDVGQRTWEEIDVVVKGGNYGWDCREGRQPYDQRDSPSSSLCASAGAFQEPIHVYGHGEGSSVTGGYVSRWPGDATLSGQYVFGDFGSGRIWALSLTTASAMLLDDSPHFISTLGSTEDGQVLVGAYFADGSPSALYRLVEQ